MSILVDHLIIFCSITDSSALEVVVLVDGTVRSMVPHAHDGLVSMPTCTPGRPLLFVSCDNEMQSGAEYMVMVMVMVMVLFQERLAVVSVNTWRLRHIQARTGGEHRLVPGAVAQPLSSLP
jgi:hypothetical protein